jgi:hypothetical protein
MAKINEQGEKDSLLYLIGKNVKVEVVCYKSAFMHPVENILVAVTDTEYVFKSDEIDSEDKLWRFPIKCADCSCIVYPA